jgi:Rrf2 family protein
MISQTAEYALRAIVYMSQHNTKSHVVENMAQAIQVPSKYLSKVMQNLGKAGLVLSQRGLGGGFSLAKPPTGITVYDVVQAVDPIKRIVSCPLKLAGHGANLCPLHRKLDDAMGALEKTFRNTSVQDLLDEPARSKPLCPFPFPQGPQKKSSK